MAAPYTPDGSSGRAQRLTEPQILVLVKDIVGMMTEGKATRTIITKYEELGYSPGQIRTLLERSAFEIKEQYKDSVTTVYEKALNRLEMLYQKAHDKGHYKTCVEIQKEIDKITGLHNNRLEITGEISIPEIIKITEIKNGGTGS
jgi:hypothetical protein